MNLRTLITWIVAILVVSQSQAQTTSGGQVAIRPNTVFCTKGSDAQPTTYCANSNPCRTAISPTGGTVQVCLRALLHGAPLPAGATEFEDLTRDCWEKVSEYTCVQYTSDCGPMQNNSNCKQIGNGNCTQGEPSGVIRSAFPGTPTGNSKMGSCSVFEHTYTCNDPGQAGTSPTNTTCDSTSPAAAALSWQQTAPDDTFEDLVEVAATAEINRQLSTYADKGSSGEISNIFRGVKQDCSKTFDWTGTVQTKDCCNEHPAVTMTNGTLMQKITGQAVGALVTRGFKAGAAYAVQAGSDFVIDSIYSTGYNFMHAGIENALMSGSLVGSLTSNAGALANAAAAASQAASTAQQIANTSNQTYESLQAIADLPGSSLAEQQAADIAAQNAVYDAGTATSLGLASNNAAKAAGDAISNSAAGFGMFGFGTTASGAAGLLGSASSTVLAKSSQIGTIGGQGIWFNPYALGAAIAMQVFTNATSCGQHEVDLATARNESQDSAHPIADGLCHLVEQGHCSAHAFGDDSLACTETLDVFCCYNSFLAKAIAETSRTVISGLTWGTGGAPNCGGLTVAQIQTVTHSTGPNGLKNNPSYKYFEDSIRKKAQDSAANFNNTANNANRAAIKTEVSVVAAAAAKRLCVQRKLSDASIVCPP